MDDGESSIMGIKEEDCGVGYGRVGESVVEMVRSYFEFFFYKNKIICISG